MTPLVGGSTAAVLAGAVEPVGGDGQPIGNEDSSGTEDSIGTEDSTGCVEASGVAGTVGSAPVEDRGCSSITPPGYPGKRWSNLRRMTPSRNAHGQMSSSSTPRRSNASA